MAGHQQVARLDRETREPIGPGVARRIVELAREHLAAFDGLILSDYAKGLLTPGLAKALVELFRGAAKPVVVDPKGRDFSRYRGATLITPNQREANLALGLDCARMATAERRAEAMMSRHRWSAILVTRGSQGVSLFRPGQPALTVPAQARQVFDVSGAGDTVAAVVGLSLACGWAMDLAAWLGNLAGGIVVGKLGTAAVTAEEIKQALGPEGQEKEER
jgi:D-beta-D-heptose 7-phosphate kinase/D-beta-D-heptose 1-phosphate adenosyltransferase